MASASGDASGKDKAEPMRMQSPRFTFTSYIVFTVCFVALVLISVTIGALGPKAYTTKETTNHNHLVCRKADCNVKWRGRLTHMSPLHQGLVLNAVVETPLTAKADGSSTMLPAQFNVEFPLVFHLNMTGRAKHLADGHAIETNSEHAREVRCHAGQSNCTAVPIFALTHVEYKEYDISIEIDHPTEALERLGLHTAVRIRFYASFVNKRFTQFEAGFKYFFATVSLLGAAVYTGILMCTGGRGEKGVGSACARLTSDQGWAMALLWGLSAFDDPFFLAAVYTPGVAWPAINTFSTVTFLAMLLLYFLCQAHAIAVSGESARPGGAEGGPGSGGVKRDAWFYLFKLVFIMAFWMLSLVLSMYVLYELEVDPSYSVEDDDLLSQGYGRFLFGLAIAVGVVYLLWLALYFVLAVRQCGRLPPYMQLWLTLTFITVLTILSVYWVGGFFVTREKNAALTFICLHTTVNCYVYLLAIGALPGYDSGSIDWAVEEAQQEARGARRGRFRGGGVAGEGGEEGAEVLGRAGGAGGYRDDVLVEIGDEEDEDEEDENDEIVDGDAESGSLGGGAAAAASVAAAGDRFGSEDRARRTKSGKKKKAKRQQQQQQAKKGRGGGDEDGLGGIELTVGGAGGDDFDSEFELQDGDVDVELGPGGRKTHRAASGGTAPTSSRGFADDQDADLEV